MRSAYRARCRHDGDVTPALEKSGVRLTVLAVAALLLAQVHLKTRPPTLCPLRALTGIPCPFCGGTTAAMRVGRADVMAALRASPLAVFGAPVVAVWPLLSQSVARLPVRLRFAALAAVLVGSELWQLHRFGWI